MIHSLRDRDQDIPRFHLVSQKSSSPYIFISGIFHLVTPDLHPTVLTHYGSHGDVPLSSPFPLGCMTVLLRLCASWAVASQCLCVQNFWDQDWPCPPQNCNRRPCWAKPCPPIKIFSELHRRLESGLPGLPSILWPCLMLCLSSYFLFLFMDISPVHLLNVKFQLGTCFSNVPGKTNK